MISKEKPSENRNGQGILSSFRCAFKGIGLLFKERNARIHLVATLVVLSASLYFELDPLEWVSVLLCIGIVLSAEAFNSSIEQVVDLVSPQQNDKAGTAKDLAAGAVLLAAITAAIVGTIIFGPRIYEALF